MNTPIRRLAVFSMILFGALMLQATWIQGFQADAIREDPLNNRQYSERLTEQRGPIQVAGEPVAYSEDVSEEDDQARYQRMYNGGDLYTPIVGSFRSYGASGVEEAENSLLDGSDDRLAARNLRDILTGNDPGGARVELTLDPEVQQAGYDGFANEGKNGAAVALDPSTGSILGAVSYPSYDANDVVSIDAPQEAVDNYVELEQNGDQPLLNRALNERYPPGSTFKVVTAASAIENLGASADSTMDAPDTLDLGRPLPNATPGGTCNDGDPDTLAHSIQISCNTSMANWAIEMGGDQLSEQATAFGFNPDEVLETPLEVTRAWRLPRRTATFSAGPGSARATSRPHRCRWRWSPRVSPTPARSCSPTSWTGSRNRTANPRSPPRTRSPTPRPPAPAPPRP